MKRHFLNELFNLAVTEDITRYADNYSVETKFECPDDEDTPCRIYCTLSLGSEKTFVFVECFHDGKTEKVGHIEYWGRDDEAILIASETVCEITKKIKTEFLDKQRIK